MKQFLLGILFTIFSIFYSYIVLKFLDYKECECDFKNFACFNQYNPSNFFVEYPFHHSLFKHEQTSLDINMEKNELNKTTDYVSRLSSDKNIINEDFLHEQQLIVDRFHLEEYIYNTAKLKKEVIIDFDGLHCIFTPKMNQGKFNIKDLINQAKEARDNFFLNKQDTANCQHIIMDRHGSVIKYE